MNKISVRIGESVYVISGDKSEAEITAIADRVNRTMEAIRENQAGLSQVRLAVLAALNISEDCFELEQGAREKEETIRTLGKELRLEREEAKRQSAEKTHYKDMWEKAKTGKERDEEGDTLRATIKDQQASLKELGDRCAEYENHFFDIRMENIRLKNELDKLQGRR